MSETDVRTEIIEDLRTLTDVLSVTDVPLSPYGHPLNTHILSDSDTDGLTEIARIAEALGVPVTDHAGNPPTAATSQYAAILRVGKAEYRAVYCTKTSREAYQAGLRHLRECQTKV